MHERINMAVVDIYGEFLTVDMGEEVIMVLWVSLSELMAKTEPSTYRNFATIDNGHMVPHVKL